MYQTGILRHGDVPAAQKHVRRRLERARPKGPELPRAHQPGDAVRQFHRKRRVRAQFAPTASCCSTRSVAAASLASASGALPSRAAARRTGGTSRRGSRRARRRGRRARAPGSRRRARRRPAARAPARRRAFRGTARRLCARASPPRRRRASRRSSRPRPGTRAAAARRPARRRRRTRRRRSAPPAWRRWPSRRPAAHARQVPQHRVLVRGRHLLGGAVQHELRAPLLDVAPVACHQQVGALGGAGMCPTTVTVASRADASPFPPRPRFLYLPYLEPSPPPGTAVAPTGRDATSAAATRTRATV